MDRGSVGNWAFGCENVIRGVSFPTSTLLDVATDQKIVESIAKINLLASAVASQAQEVIASVIQKAKHSQEGLRTIMPSQLGILL